jgi:hypothetical protein
MENINNEVYENAKRSMEKLKELGYKPNEMTMSERYEVLKSLE